MEERRGNVVLIYNYGRIFASYFGNHCKMNASTKHEEVSEVGAGL
jgi:hypothetical protein